MRQFDEVISRIGTDSEKWDGAEALFGRKRIIPMWVADMDFKAPEPVLQALQEKVDFGIFGYTSPPDSLKQAIIDWNKRRHGFTISSESILYNDAVVPSISLAIRILTNEGDSVLMNTPIYPPFFKVTKETNRKVVMSPLIYKDNQFKVDFNDIEEKLQQEDIKVFLLCNPQNPGGHVFTKEDLVQLAELCQKYHVPIVSDEIHADLVMKKHKHIPLALAAPFYTNEIITLMAPTKTFNLAAIKASYIIVPNPQYRKRMEEAQSYIHAAELNIFAITAMEAAYNYGEDWLDELRDYIYENYLYAKAEIEKNCPEIIVSDLEATYLMWLDARMIAKTEAKLYQDIIASGCGVQMGSDFGECGTGFIRVNIACPRKTLEKGIAALIAGIKAP